MVKAEAYFNSIDELPDPRPYPAIAQRIVAACEKPDVDACEVSDVIQCDPAVSLGLMRIANSSLYGFSGQIRSVEHAIVVLGLRTVKDLSVSAAAASLFSDSDNSDIRQQLWMHSLACGAVAAQLAPRFGVSASEAFLAGVVHDVGKLLLLDVVSDRYIELTKDANSCTIVDTEERCFGVNHQQVGARCANEWGLPMEISSAIEFHHTPDDAYAAQELAGLVCLANSLAIDWGMATNRAHAKENQDEVRERCGLQVPDGEIDGIRDLAMEQLKVVMGACG